MTTGEKGAYFKWAAILFIAVLIFVFFAFYAPKFGQTALVLQVRGNKLSITTVKASREEITALDPHKYYIDSATGFRFKLPADQAFSKPMRFEGIDGLLAAKEAVLNPEFREQLQRNLRAHPLGPVFETAKILRVVYGKPLDVEFTNDTTNELIEKVLAKVKNEAQEHSVELTSEDLSKIRRSALGFDRIKFQDEFMVTILDKGKLGDVPIKVTLPGLFATFSAAMGLYADKLVADEQSILAGGSVSLQHVKVDGGIRDFGADRWFLITENKEAFFLVEIAFSPQTSEPMKAWEDLRDMMVSFRSFD